MWEMIIGLETHVELAAKTKIFCSCPTDFGAAPNTQCCEVCTGQPGSLPVLNETVVMLAIRAGLALGCRINNRSVMARKHYVYPDLPKGYQISQFDKPLCEKGAVTLSTGREIGITRIHIEEDAAKLTHEQDAVLIDYNRGGVPLIEIVTEPDFRSAAEVSEYLKWLQTVLRALDVSDCRMQEGSMRCDVNISLRRTGETEYKPRAEVKNLNSFTSVVSAIEYEYSRQLEILQSGGETRQETRSFSAETGETTARRGKENADDYRYCPEPDITHVHVSDETIDLLRKTMPETPDAKLRRYISELGVTEADAALICKYKAVSSYFEEAAEGVNDAKSVAAIIVTAIFAVVTTEAEREGFAPKTTPEQLRELVLLTESGKLSKNMQKRVLSKMLETGKPCGEFLTAEDLAEFSDETLTKLCREAVENDEKAANDYRAGKEKAMRALVGAVMRASKGRADAVKAERLLQLIVNS